ncbi:MAG: hypothetical protein JWN37_840 [Candidatus Nomurabacteria bacterium]|nr:hypothetical protein [Candidatus Nomurabacteria bacterium]
MTIHEIKKFINKFDKSSGFFSGNVKGFTLVELLVSMALFISIITIAVGALFSAQAINARLEQSQVILDGVNLVVEGMTRDIRYGSQFYCGVPTVAPVPRNDCSYRESVGSSFLVLKPVEPLAGTTDPTQDRITYSLENGVIYKDEYANSNVNNKKRYQITSSDVFISNLTFYVSGALSSTNGGTDTNQPVITLILAGKTLPNNVRARPVTFNVETSISSRGLDN